MKFKVVVAKRGSVLPDRVYWFNTPIAAEREVEKANIPGHEKHHYWKDVLPGVLGNGEVTPRDYWGIGIDPEPEVNEWGEVGL